MKGRIWAVAGAVLGTASGAWAQFGDLTIGGAARSFAMGGAGVATASGAGRVNPAALAFDKGPVTVHMPGLGFRADGALRIDNGRLLDVLFNSDRAGAAEKLARSFAREDSSFGLNAVAGVRVGHLEGLATGVGLVRLQPNATLANWAQAGGGGNAPAGSRADILAAAVYTLPTIGFATTLPDPNEKRRFNIAVGGRLKYMTGIYSHYIATTTGNGLYQAQAASELGGDTQITRDGIGADLGVLLQSRGGSDQLSLGATIANLIKPGGFRFEGTNRNDARKTYDLLATTLSAGAAFHRGATTMLADLVDLTSAAGPRQVRAGLEQKVGAFAFRGGYSSATGFTWGLGGFGLDLAFGKRQPLEVVKTLRF